MLVLMQWVWVQAAAGNRLPYPLQREGQQQSWSPTFTDSYISKQVQAVAC